MIHEISAPKVHDQKEAHAVEQFKDLLEQGQDIAIKKNVKHIFKDRDKRANLDLRRFNQVLSVDTSNNIATVEGLTSFYDLVEATLPFNLMPQAVPELRSITVGGAVAGLGGQSSSFRFGLVHEMVTDFDLLTGQGEVLHCSPQSNRDLYYMLPNSYGSLGYVLRCNIRLNPVQPLVKVRCVRFANRDAFFNAMAEEVHNAEADFIEGVSFAPTEFILLLGDFASELPPGERRLVPRDEPFFKRIQDPGIDHVFLTIKDYIWRWDPDAFWATDQGGMVGAALLNPTFRKTIGRFLLRSDRLIKIGQYRNKLRKTGAARYVFMESQRKEALIQDAAIPIDKAADFDAWLANNLNIFPLWYCPVRTTKPLGTYPLYDPGSVFVIDFGFYISMELEDSMEPTHYNRQIENKLLEIGGIKCLYSDTFFSEEQFWSMYDKEQYDQVKAKYDPDGTFLNLYDKVINKTT